MSDSKNMVLIGGSYGIGANLSQQLTDKGHSVYVLSRSKPSNARVHHIHFDVSSDPIEEIELPDAIHGLVYLPGTISLKPFHRFTESEFLADLQLNTLAAARCINALLKSLKNSGNASVVLFSTVAVQQGMPFHTSVAMAKGALEGLTRSLAAELAPVVRVNAIAPSITDTPLASKILSSDEKKKASGERHPMRRVGKPSDIASAAAYLLDDQSSWITGQILPVDGGLSALRI